MYLDTHYGVIFRKNTKYFVTNTLNSLKILELSAYENGRRSIFNVLVQQDSSQADLSTEVMFCFFFFFVTLLSVA